MRGSAEVGFCELQSRGHFFRAASAQASLLTHDLEVDEACQGRGYGRYLLRKALWEAHQLGFTDATLCVMPDNDRATMLYAAEGFRKEATSHQLSRAVGQGANTSPRREEENVSSRTRWLWRASTHPYHAGCLYVEARREHRPTVIPRICEIRSRGVRGGQVYAA